jgi:arginine/serine-rich splicing factor 16
VSEEKFLHQIHLEEQFGSVVTTQRAKEDEKKKLSEKKAAIAYVYEDSSPVPQRPVAQDKTEEAEPEEEEEDVSDIDFGK